MENPLPSVQTQLFCTQSLIHILAAELQKEKIRALKIQRHLEPFSLFFYRTMMDIHKKSDNLGNPLLRVI